MNQANKPMPANPSAAGFPGAVAPLLEEVRRRIVDVRGRSGIVDADVAALYGVETKRVNEAVRNNPDKFPPDYLFELDADESRSLRTKISTLNLNFLVGKIKHVVKKIRRNPSVDPRPVQGR